MLDIDTFNNLEVLEPKCPRCKGVLDFGNNTVYDEKLGRHICLKCKTQL